MAVVYDIPRRIELAEERARVGATQTERLFFQDKADELRIRYREKDMESCPLRYF